MVINIYLDLVSRYETECVVTTRNDPAEGQTRNWRIAKMIGISLSIRAIVVIVLTLTVSCGCTISGTMLDGRPLPGGRLGRLLQA
jgi:hypothetical protein